MRRLATTLLLPLLIVALAAGPSALAAAPEGAPGGATLDLAQAQALAQAHSPRLKEGAAAADAARSRERAAQSRFFPKVGLQARYSRVSHVEPGSITLPLAQPDGQPLPAVQLGEAIDDQLSLRLTAEQPLFTGFGLSRGLEAARQGGEVVAASRAVDRADLRLRVEEAYLGLARARRVVAVAEDTLRTLAAREQDVQRLVAAERATALDATRMRAQVAGARAAVARAEAGEEASRAALASLIGWPEEAVLAIADPLADDEPETYAALADLGTGDDAIDVAVARRVARLRATQAEALEAGLWPQVALRLGATVANPNERYFPARSEWNASWDASLVVSWQFDSLATVHEARAADADAAAAIRAAEALSERTQLEARRQRAALAGAVAAVSALRESVTASERAVADTDALFHAGRAALTEVLDRQSELERARLDLLDARVEARLADARWRRWTEGLPPSVGDRSAQ